MDVVKLIQTVQSKPQLWNQAHPDHQNRFVVGKLWDEVAKELQLDRNTVQKKWKYLRDYMRHEQSKLPKKRSGDGATSIRSSWQYYDMMLFLKDQLKNRKSDGNLKRCEGEMEETDTESHQSNVSSNETQIFEIENAEIEDFTEMQNAERQDTPDSMSIPSTSTPTSASRGQNEESMDDEPRVVLARQKRKTPSEIYGRALLNIEQQKLEYLKNKSSTKGAQKEEQNDDNMFFDSLLPYVAKIPQNKKLCFRSKVQELVQKFAFDEQQQEWSVRVADSNLPPQDFLAQGTSTYFYNSTS